MSEQKDTYVIWIEFNDEYMDFLNKKCEELTENSIEQGFKPPHITMTFVENCDEEKLLEYTEHYFKENTVKLMINSIGIFSGGFVFYAPKVTEELLAFHRDYCEGIRSFGDLAWDLYCPKNWTPHIALTGALGEDELIKAVSILKKDFVDTEIYIKKVAIRKNGILQKEIEL